MNYSGTILAGTRSSSESTRNKSDEHPSLYEVPDETDLGPSLNRNTGSQIEDQPE
jgi:hypothetical protein